MGILENSLLLVALLAVLGLGLVYLGLRQGTVWMLGVGGTLLVAAGGVWLADQWVDTPAEQVDRRLDELAAASERSDVEFLVAALSDTVVAENYSRDGLAQLIRREVPRIRFRSVRLTAREFRPAGDQPEGNRVVARFVAKLDGGDGEYPLRFEMTFVKEQSVWQIARIRRLDLLNPDQEVPVGSY